MPGYRHSMLLRSVSNAAGVAKGVAGGNVTNRVTDGPPQPFLRPVLTIPKRKMLIQRDTLVVRTKIILTISIVKLCITPVDCFMMIRANKHKIFQLITSTPAQPMDMMCVTEIVIIVVARVPATDLTLSCVS